MFVYEKETIKQQIEKNSTLNLLNRDNRLHFSFSEELNELITLIRRGKLSPSDVNELLQFTASVVLSSFYRVNQFYQFNTGAQKALQEVYRQLLDEISIAATLDFSHLAEQHFLRLHQWFLTHQPDAHLLFPNNTSVIVNSVVCAEYSVATQLKTLGIDLENVGQPILDIGCGWEHHLVKYFRQKGFETIGIDRDTEITKFTKRISWLDFDYTKNTWGTIVSHLGFSNHFRHQHLKQNGDYMAYAHTFLDILQSLKKGRIFYYAPDLPFIEAFLNPQQYRIRKQRVANTLFCSVAIQRIR